MLSMDRTAAAAHAPSIGDAATKNKGYSLRHRLPTCVLCIIFDPFASIILYVLPPVATGKTLRTRR